MIPSIQAYCESLVKKFDLIPEERKQLLNKIADYIRTKSTAQKTVQLIYICTHNSRRSHFGQVWAQVAASYFKLVYVKTFSGGTEATAFNMNAINALKRIGFKIESDNIEANPKYQVWYDLQKQPVLCFSKVYDDVVNPKESFAAIMTCSDAEENCPFIAGAELRIGTTYKDPKEFDQTPAQDAAYDERCAQIALETLYVFSKI